MDALRLRARGLGEVVCGRASDDAGACGSLVLLLLKTGVVLPRTTVLLLDMLVWGSQLESEIIV